MVGVPWGCWHSARPRPKMTMYAGAFSLNPRTLCRTLKFDGGVEGPIHFLE